MLLCVTALAANAQSIGVQCPTTTEKHPDGRGIKCAHLGAGDGFITMADSTLPFYTFGFSDLTGITEPRAVMQAGMLAGSFPAPTIVVDEGDELFLTLTNVGMMMRPDLFDPHSVHWHGFPQAASIFDGVPDSSVVINMGASMTYYYNVVEPGTYLYHCHVEATEHMQMGMLGNLYVRPAQNKRAPGTVLGGWIHRAGDTYAYNDGDGSTRYDLDFPIQMSSMDPAFHHASISVQPLPFASMRDTYFMLNGRGYPDTVNTSAILTEGRPSQAVHSFISANQGDRILLRISNVSVTVFNTLATIGIPMQVVGLDARLLRDDAGNNLYYTTNSITLGGGQSADVILDTTNIAPGTYFLYTTNLHNLANDAENFGGMMTEILIN
jgi:FtsP/CotA-like multicopper oxidase with cupredoxin domain